MLRIFILSILFWAVFDAGASESYYGANSHQVIAKFHGKIQFNLAQHRMTDAFIYSKVKDQIFQAIGPLRRQPKSGSFYPDFKIKVLKTKAFGNTGYADYEFTGKMAVHKDLNKKIQLVLTRNPDMISHQTGKTCFSEESSFPFWYYWDPSTKGCRVQAGEHYDIVEAELTPLPNNELAYPEYARLVDHGVIDVHAFFGPDKKWDPDLDADNSKDIGVKQYRRFRKTLRESGYEIRKWSTEEVRLIYPYAKAWTPLVEEATLPTARGLIRVRMFLGQTFVLNVFQNSAFQVFWKNALETAAVVMYSGHAGQGYNLKDWMIEWRQSKIRMPQDKYQILHLATCIPYTYYTEMFFDMKPKNIDVLGYAGGETLFKFMSVDMLNTLSSIRHWAETGERLSYQLLAARIQNEPFLFYASGIGDNPIN